MFNALILAAASLAAGDCPECAAYARQHAPRPVAALAAPVAIVVQHVAERAADHPQPLRQLVRRVFGGRRCGGR